MSTVVPCWRCSSCAALMWWVYRDIWSSQEVDTTLILPDPCSVYEELLCPYCGEVGTIVTLEVIPVPLDDFVSTQIWFPFVIEAVDDQYHFFLADEDFTPHAEYGIYMLTLYRSWEPVASSFLDVSIDEYFLSYWVDIDEDQWILSFGAHQIFVISL